MLDTEALVDEELVRVVCPVTLRVPLEVRDVVAVIAPPVIDPAESEVIKELTALMTVAIRPVVVVVAVTFRLLA